VALPENLTFLASSAKTTTQTQADQVNRGHSGIKVVVDTTVFGTGSVTVTIQGLDPTSGKYYTILASAAIVATGTVVLTVFPGAPVTGNVAANDQLPATWRLLATANNANSQTYSVGYVLLP
jgi:acyl CoA:acetate/3-ketoacid CoA transferase beta subunit